MGSITETVVCEKSYTPVRRHTSGYSDHIIVTGE